MKHTTICRHILSLLLIWAISFSLGFARDDNSGRLQKPSTVEYELFEGNNIRNYIGNHGQLVSHIPRGDAGLEWPAGSGKTTNYSSGIWVIGKVDGEVRSAAAEFAQEWTPGTIPYDTQTKLPTSDAPDNSVDHQIYFIQHDNSSDPGSVNYNREYATWPASDGAPSHDGEFFTDLNQNGTKDAGEPFEDFNMDGSYNPPDGHLVTGEDPALLEGDEMAWWVMNDWDTTAHDRLWHTAPLGLEAQVSIYNRTAGPIYENVQFHDVKLVNKGGEHIDSVYYSFWNDADIGYATDDFVGCDTALDMGYVYNGRPYDGDYGLTPPSQGYCILRGPIVASPGDTAEYLGTVFTGVRSLGMTAHVKFTGSDAYFGDPETARGAFHIMQGLKGYYGAPYHEYLDPSRPTTPFLYSGDPVSRTGWTEYDDSSPGDRRNVTSSGPFIMEPWDDVNGNGQADFGEPGVQIIQCALIVVAGADNLDAITSLKYVTGRVRSDFAHGFESPQFEAPAVSISANDQEIVLNWYEGSESYESLISSGYAFEGYNVYQGETAQGPWTLLRSFDVSNGIGRIVEQSMNDYGIVGTELVQFGDDTGLSHLLSITEDALAEDAPLTNNKLYHFALSAYGYNEDMLPRSLESPKRVLNIRPQLTYEMAGVRDTLEVEHIGNSDMQVTVDVLDPGQLTGLDYTLGFEYDSSQALARWHVTRRSGSFQDTALSSDWGFVDYREYWRFDDEKIYLDGVELSLEDISFLRPRINRGWQQTTNIEGSSIDSLILKAVAPGGVDSLAWDIMGSQMVHLDTLYGPSNPWDWYRTEERADGTYFILYRENTHRVHIIAFASNFGAIGGDRLADIPNIGGGSYDFEFLQSDLEIRFTESGQNATMYYRPSSGGIVTDGLIRVPFEIWDIERNFQLCIATFDWNKTGGIQDTTKENWEHTLDLDWVVVFDQDYTTHGDSIMEYRDNPKSGWSWIFNDNSIFSVGDVLKLHFVNPINPAIETFQWSTDVVGAIYDKDALDQIQVFPNPYFGYHPDQTSASSPFVTFSNLPEQECTIRVYSLGGHLVKRFDHEIGAYENWNLLNEGGHRVASGIYILHIEVPDLGNRIMKLAILQPE